MLSLFVILKSHSFFMINDAYRPNSHFFVPDLEATCDNTDANM